MSKKNKILIIATAAYEGGALTILSQFLNTIPEPDKDKYILLISKKLTCQTHFTGFEQYKIDTSKWLKRIFFDLYGYRRFIQKEKLRIDLCINFQNIPSRIGPIPQIVYMHQSLPFYRYNWNLFNKSEAKYWLYSKFYSRFIKLNAKSASYFIVQSSWLRDVLSEYLNFQKDYIKVFKPGISAIFMDKASYPKKKGGGEGNIYIYPAAEYTYKNHTVLLDALKCLGETYLSSNAVKIIFTVSKSSVLAEKVQSMQLQKYVSFVGAVTHGELNDYYGSVRGLLFPSNVESFGLPLIEGACKGLRIIAADLPYAQEAVSGYGGVCFAKPDDASSWANLIKADIENNKDELALFQYDDDWKELLFLISCITAKN